MSSRTLVAPCVWLSMVMSSVLAVGCVGPLGATARLYELQTGQILFIHLDQFSEGRGTVSGELPDGEVLTGEYRVSKRGDGTPPIIRPMERENQTEADRKPNLETFGGKTGMSWPEVYGYGPNADASPNGTGVAVGNRGTVVEFVFYSVDLRRGDADGVGRDNKGKWYRLQVGDLK